MADRAHRCECRSLVVDSVCISKCAVAASAGLFRCWRSLAEWDGAYVGNDFRAYRSLGPFSTSCTRLLFFSAAFRSLDLSAASIERNPWIARRSGRFLIQKEAHAEKSFSEPWIYVRGSLFLCGCGFNRASKAWDERGRGAAARRACGTRARPCFRILRPVSAPEGPAGRGNRRSRSRTHCTICKALQFGTGALLFRPGGDAEEDASSGGARVHQYLRSSPRGGDLRAVRRSRDDGKAAGGQPRRCTGHRESGARCEDSGFGELRDHLVSQQPGGLRLGA